jgi:hypothetical protein
MFGVATLVSRGQLLFRGVLTPKCLVKGLRRCRSKSGGLRSADGGRK